MADYLGMGAQLAGNALRFGWYSGVGWLMDWESRRLGSAHQYRPTRPVPSREELTAELRRCLMEDATLVRDGILPPGDDEPDGVAEHLGRIRAMLKDLSSSVGRREADERHSVRSLAGAEGLPDYFVQDFHFQTGGYLSEDSARLYDVQVETLFRGTAAAMRRAALRPIAAFLAGRDQRRAALLDVACGTGRFLRQARLAFPALRLTGLDLSAAYLEEAERHLGALRPAVWLTANAEAIPLPGESQDIVTTVFLFHELPPEVRRRVAAEMARVLRPGGLMVFVDSLQMGDRPGWDGLLEAFPVRFHEPYYRHYATDDLAAMFRAAGLEPNETQLSFLSKVMTCRKPA